MYTRSIYVAAAAAAARVFATPWRACTCACAPLRIRVDPHTRVQPDRACLCGDPNEGRQASKLGRAAAARAAILLESGWKTSGAAVGRRSLCLNLGPRPDSVVSSPKPRGGRVRWGRVATLPGGRGE